MPKGVYVGVTIHNEDLIKRLDKAIEDAGSDIVKNISYRVAQAARAFAPKSGFRHGNKTLAQDIIVKPQGRFTYNMIVGKNLDRNYALYQEYGFKPHVPPKDSPAIPQLIQTYNLRWPKFKVAKHTPFIQPALDNIETYIQRELVQIDRHVGRA